MGMIITFYGDDCIFCGGEPELLWITEKMRSLFEIKKVRALLRPEEGDDEEVILFGRQVRWTATGIEHEAEHNAHQGESERTHRLSAVRQIC